MAFGGLLAVSLAGIGYIQSVLARERRGPGEGRLVHPATRHEFRERRLFDGGGRELVATVVVDGEGNVTVNE